MQTVALPPIEIDSSILISLKNTQDEFAEKMKHYTAIALYRKNRLSLGKAAQLIGLDRLSFIELLKHEGVPIFDYDTVQTQAIFDEADRLSDMLS